MAELIFLSIISLLLSCNSEELIVANDHKYSKEKIEKLLKMEKEISTLIIGNYKDTIFPNDFILKFENLNKIIIWGTAFSKHRLHIDASILANLKRLKVLQITALELDSFPSSISLLDSLTSLELGFCCIKKIPADVSRLHRLITLNLWGNELKTLPDSLNSLVNLQTVGLNNNQFTTIPQVLTKLPNIQAIDLSNREGSKAAGLNVNEIFYKTEMSSLIEILKKRSVKKVYIQVKDCDSKKTIKNAIGEKRLIRKVNYLPVGICNPLMGKE